MFAGASSDHAGDGGVAKDSLQNILTEMENNDWSGLISVGPPRSGKSLLSKAIGATYDVPTIAFDLGATRTSLVGASEQAVRACFRVLRAIAGDGAFWVATCNKYESLPPELKRRFRYGIRYTGLPDDNELTSIWDLQRRRYRIDPGDQRPTGVRYSGADVGNICEIAYRMNMRLVDAAQFIVPVSVSDPQSINKLEEAATGRFLSAIYPGTYNHNGAAKAVLPSAQPQARVRALGHMES
jgi:SpoVK/Ycf46/Vps4 family AAA+-type ATPase